LFANSYLDLNYKIKIKFKKGFIGFGDKTRLWWGGVAEKA
jgi:hypothetical protein